MANLAITYDTYNFNKGTSVPISVDILTAEANEIIIAVVHTNVEYSMESLGYTVTAKLDGSDMTLIRLQHTSYDSTPETVSAIGIDVFWRLASSSGPHTVQADAKDNQGYNVGVNGVGVGAIAWKGVHASSPIDDSGGEGGVGDSPSLTITATVSNTVAIGCVSGYKKLTVTPGLGFTEIYDEQCGSGAPSNYVTGESEYKSVASSGDLTVDCTLSSSQFYGFVAFNLKPPGISPGWNKLQFVTEPPTGGAFNKLKYASEPPVSGAWNKILYSGE